MCLRLIDINFSQVSSKKKKKAVVDMLECNISLSYTTYNSRSPQTLYYVSRNLYNDNNVKIIFCQSERERERERRDHLEIYTCLLLLCINLMESYNEQVRLFTTPEYTIIFHFSSVNIKMLVGAFILNTYR